MTAHTAVLLAKLPGPPGPTAARPRQAPALHGPPPRPSDSDRATARERTIPPAGTNGPQAFLPDKILGPPRARHCRAPAGTRTALTLPRSGDSERATLARTQPRRRAASLEPARARPTRSSATPRDSGIRLSPPPEILSRPPACHCQARQDTRCTDSPAGRRPGLGRAPVTPYRSCTPRARRELRRCRPLEPRHSGCTGTTAASGDSDTPP